MNGRSALFIVIVSTCLVLIANSLSAQTTHCTQITSVPISISTGGVYCLTKNLSTTDTAIAIAANNVVLDLNGFAIIQTSGAGNTKTGIFANSQKHITVRNGSVIGFYVGISLYDPSPFTIASANVIEDMRVTGSTFTAMQNYGTGNVVRNNVIFKTGGSTSSSANGNAIGIDITGSSNDVENNFIVNTTGTASGKGTAISLQGNQELAVNNHIVTAVNGINSSSTGECRDNVAIGVTNKYPNCIDLGNNK